ncbi:hypothetical protein B0H14DRAFT_2530791 [Mycena olivaceomarginata]|nr:hypothetical protein B0H14DRAFT_2530791 [Mycena olivaceomarginata]
MDEKSDHSREVDTRTTKQRLISVSALESHLLPFPIFAPATSSRMHPDLTVDEIINQCQRFRILSVGRAGAGKSSLIQSCVQCQRCVSRFEPGEADIYSEITSETNTRFVLHDSKGFEPSKTDTFDVVREFILKKNR